MPLGPQRCRRGGVLDALCDHRTAQRVRPPVFSQPAGQRWKKPRRECGRSWCTTGNQRLLTGLQKRVLPGCTSMLAWVWRRMRRMCLLGRTLHTYRPRTHKGRHVARVRRVSYMVVENVPAFAGMKQKVSTKPSVHPGGTFRTLPPYSYVVSTNTGNTDYCLTRTQFARTTVRAAEPDYTVRTFSALDAPEPPHHQGFHCCAAATALLPCCHA